MVDGGPLKWQHYLPLENKSEAEGEEMSIDDITAEEELCIERNAWKVAEDVCNRIHMEPGPADDLMLALVTPKKSFFYNTAELTAFHKAAKRKRDELPGSCYFSKIESFMNDHSVKGELFMELRTCGDSDFCQALPHHHIQQTPRPFPD